MALCPATVRPRAPRGVTLLELLVVMLILLMVTAAAIPMMAPALQNRRMREAARLASSYISGARARAIQNGRDVGVMIERFQGRPYAITLSYVEVPPPYSGESAQSTCKCTSISGATVTLTMQNGFNAALVREQDQIQLNYQGPFYSIISVTPPTVTAVLLNATAATRLPWNPASPSVPYQILRQPVRSSAAPLQLPDSIVIDLMFSGSAPSAIWGDTTIPVANWSTTPPVPFNPVIVFTPGGSVSYLATPNLTRPIGPVYLLLGRRELMADVTKLQVDENINDPNTPNPKNLYLENRWITIGYQTGLVTTSEVRAIPPVNPPTLPDVVKAREFAQSAQGIGGQ
jgi:prepilin-type N-terminal cleavage/methylation domain-containing protein